MRRQRGRMGLMAAALVGLMTSGVLADVTTERSASILVFPKVIADGTRDTIIQITNTGNSMVHAHCFYVNGALTFPDGPDGIPGNGDEGVSPQNPPLWTEIDFDIWLTKQQPTVWVASQGRLVDPSDNVNVCTKTNHDCNGVGFDPGRVPPVVEGFTGELKCVEVDDSGMPTSGDHLKGEATLESFNNCVDGACSLSGVSCLAAPICDRSITDIAKYNGLGIRGLETNNMDEILCLGGTTTTAACPNGAEYQGCPQTWVLDHQSDGSEDPFVGAGSSVTTDITIVPCSEDFEAQTPSTVTVQFLATNEFEQQFSASTSVICWAELRLVDINPVFDSDAIGTTFVETTLRPSQGNPGGFLVVSDERRVTAAGATATAAGDLHALDGDRTGAPDVIGIPRDQVTPPVVQ